MPVRYQLCLFVQQCLIEPKAIICEGKSAMDRFASYYGLQAKWHNGVGFFNIDDRIEVIGYKRRYSSPVDPNALIHALNEMHESPDNRVE